MRDPNAAKAAHQHNLNRHKKLTGIEIMEALDSLLNERAVTWPGIGWSQGPAPATLNRILRDTEFISKENARMSPMQFFDLLAEDLENYKN